MHPLLSSHIVPVLLCLLLLQFSCLTLAPFSSNFKLDNLTYLGNDVLIDDMTIPLHTTLNYIFTATPTLSQRTSVDTSSTSLTPLIILIIPRCTLRNLASSATVSSHVSQQYSKTGLTQH